MKRPSHSKLSDARLKALLKGLREDVAAPPNFRAGVLERLRKEGLVAGPSPQKRLGVPLWVRMAAWLRPGPRLGLALGSGLALGLVLLLVRPFPSLPVAEVPSHGSGAAGGSSRVASAQSPSRGSGEAQAVAVQAKAALAAHSNSKPEPGRPFPSAAHSAAPASVRTEGGVASLALAGQGRPAVGSSSEISVSSAKSFSGAPASPYAASSSAQFAASRASSSANNAAKPLDDPNKQPTGTPIPTQAPTAGPTAVPTPSGPVLRQNSQVRGNVIHASRGERAQILFNVIQSGPVLVEIHDRLGRSVAVLVNATLPAGLESNLYWSGTADDGGMAASGIYEVRIVAPNYVERHKIALVK